MSAHTENLQFSREDVEFGEFMDPSCMEVYEDIWFRIETVFF